MKIDFLKLLHVDYTYVVWENTRADHRAIAMIFFTAQAYVLLLCINESIVPFNRIHPAIQQQGLSRYDWLIDLSFIHSFVISFCLFLSSSSVLVVGSVRIVGAAPAPSKKTKDSGPTWRGWSPRRGSTSVAWGCHQRRIPRRIELLLLLDVVA